jgi:hypothetical protein
MLAIQPGIKRDVYGIMLGLGRRFNFIIEQRIS